MTEFEKLYNEKKQEIQNLKEKYQLSDGFIQKIRDKESRYPTEAECQAYLEKRLKRLSYEHKSAL